MIGQLLLGAALLLFFQLSYNRVIETPVSNPVTPAVVNIVDPIEKLDSGHKSNEKEIEPQHTKREYHTKNK